MCQHLAYKNEAFTLNQSANLSQNCILPLLLIRRHAETLLDNNKVEFKKCMEHAENLKDAAKGYDSARFKCISDYKNELKS